MIIRQRRIRSLEAYLDPLVPRGGVVIPALTNLDTHSTSLSASGFSPHLDPGERLLPPDRGPVSHFNAEGKDVVHRDRQMEVAYRMIEWKWKEFRGRYDHQIRTGIRERPYKRYPRTHVPPPSIELEVVRLADRGKMIVGPQLRFNESDGESLLHTINLFLELFGECTLLTDGFKEIIRAPVRHLNWHVLPEGRHPWKDLAPRLGDLIDRAPEGNRRVIRHRLEIINDFGPEFVAIGQAGFHGYVVFGFPAKGIFVLESIHTGNATYVLDKDWEEISRLSKAEILSEKRHKARIIHRKSWDAEIRRLLK